MVESCPSVVLTIKVTFVCDSVVDSDSIVVEVVIVDSVVGVSVVSTASVVSVAIVLVIDSVVSGTVENSNVVFVTS